MGINVARLYSTLVPQLKLIVIRKGKRINFAEKMFLKLGMK
jgi:hypothetical protein